MDEKSLDYLIRLGVYDLRNYARVVGVKSPTTKNKAILIDEITQIEKGLLLPNLEIRGRTPKTPINNDVKSILIKTQIQNNYAVLQQKYEKLSQLIKQAYKLISD